LDIGSAPVIANSMGGLWTLLFAINRPQRVSAMALLGCPAVLLNTTAPLPMRILGVRGLNSFLWSRQVPSVESAKSVHKMMGHGAADLNRLPDEFWQMMYRSSLLPHFKEAWLTLLERVVGPFGARRGMPVGERELRRVSQPTLFIWGANDAFGKPSVGDRAAEIIPDARIEHVGGGHLPWIDDPTGVGSIIQSWLTQIKQPHGD
jgi:pimeloyl-ACP methyl ester carboxylesterase